MLMQFVVSLPIIWDIIQNYFNINVLNIFQSLLNVYYISKNLSLFFCKFVRFSSINLVLTGGAEVINKRNTQKSFDLYIHMQILFNHFSYICNTFVDFREGSIGLRNVVLRHFVFCYPPFKELRGGYQRCIFPYCQNE